jgi:hypothetical protein
MSYCDIYDVCDGYCDIYDACDEYYDIYDACDEYYDIYDACDEYYEIYDIPVIFGYFKREKTKKIKFYGHFAVRLSEDARQSDQNQQPKQCLCCAFIEAHDKGAIYCRAFSRQAHGNEPCLSCVFREAHGKQPMFAVRFSGRRTANSSCLPCVFSRRTAKGVPRRLAPVPLVVFFAVRRGKTHGKDCLPCVVSHGARQRGFTMQNATVRPLPCAPAENARQRLCRAVLGLCRALVAFPVVM